MHEAIKTRGILSDAEAIGAAAAPKGLKAVLRQFEELWFLLRVEFANVRDSWVWSVVMVSLFPLIVVFFLKFFMLDPSEEVMSRIITGNMVFPIIIMAINTLAQELSVAKHAGHFVFYASLPISKINFIVAKLISGFLMTLPSVLIMAVLGQLVFGITLHFSPLIIPVIILSIGSCVGFGIMMGFLSINEQMTSLLSQLIMMILSFMTPVMVPMSNLPLALQYLSYAFPTTYVADAFRTLFSTGWESNVGTDMLALAGFFVLTVILLIWKMDWRVER
ncbi:ABC transporter permease [Paenibacillus filicis]|uniref:ABC transporter permease n=1 Tax=Paenibacillus gyeongsangnamensis TaxID=3388067 RepID=A0ABT4Q907_9BACL|nr:ABC transporter permease [Paenibacillus filicis]MCZ8513175.1 ABC transporter permease [Paenibacillus filicis]